MKYRLQDLLDMKQFQNLQDRLNEICSFTLAILDNDGNILTASGWQDICTQFHRKHPDCERACRKSDQYILSHIHEANPSVSYRCENGLVDNATPIVIDGVHYGNFFTGQFFLEKPDLDYFRAQAKKYGFDEDAYIKAVEKVPIWTEEQLNSYLYFIKGLIAVISESGLKKLQEIEARKRSEDSEEHTNTILRSAMDGFFLIDIQGRLLEVNDAYCEMIGYTREELLQLSLNNLEANESDEEIAANIDRIIHTGGSRFERQHRRKDGRVIDVEMSVNYLSTFGGRIFCFIRDITERKQLEDKLRQSQKLEAIGQLAGGIAHDFNNIMAATMMQLSFLQKNASLDREAQEMLNDLMSGAKRAASLTSQLLMFSRQSVMEIKILDLNEVVANHLKLLARLIGEQITLRFERSENLPAVEADARMIEQVVMNLALNARDAMPKGGLLTIKLAPIQVDAQRVAGKTWVLPGPFVCLSVADTGNGMDEATLKRIFEPFFTTKEVGKGTGLGLATVDGIMAQHKGWVDVESEFLKGTTFKVYFPASATRTAVPIQTEKQEIIRGHETILLVEDEAILRQLMAQGLRLLGYRVLEADNGQTAMKLWQENSQQIDLLFSDMVMPEGMTGVDLAEMLKKKPNLKVIISSGYNVDMAGQDIKTAGSIVYLQKPYEVEVLSKTVRACLDRA